MSMSIGSVSSQSPLQTVQAVTPKPVKQHGQDRDGDHDGSKAARTSSTPPANSGPVSATVGNNINTTA